MINTRKLVAEALLKLYRENSYSNLMFTAALKKCDADEKEIAFASNLFYGVLERKITIDYILSKHLDKSINKLHPFVLQVLRIGVYQIYFMDSVPDSAAVDECVKLIKQSKQSFASGFANAVLRAVAREENKSLPEENSIKYSCPKELADSLVSDYGQEDACGFLADSLAVPPLYIRVNTCKISTDDLICEFLKDDIIAEKCEGVPNALKLKKITSFQNNRCFKKGYFHVQDLASQICIEKLDVFENLRVLDICAAPGGKSFTIAENMKDHGDVVACDLYVQRVGLIAEGSAKLGIKIIKPMISDATKFDENLGMFDRVLCDAPCSGFGVIRRKPEIKYKSFQEIEGLPQIQSDILNVASRYVKPGGKLVYSTCTLRKAENEHVVENFLQDHPKYELIEQTTLMPHKNGSDGFFAASLQLKSDR
ncbi:MAG: 16S rRNA (cytosine(967)-C(5))-methyltransferase RsmB [Oscillospiraceae bacterium]